jgi:hypothetical protein
MTDLPPRVGAISDALQALKSNPMVVGVLLLNALFVIAGAWYLISTESQHAEHLKMILERCLPGK